MILPRPKALAADCFSDRTGYLGCGLLSISNLAPLFAVAGLPVLAGWIVYSLLAISRLQKRYDKSDGRLLHAGAIYTFTRVNLITISEVLLNR